MLQNINNNLLTESEGSTGNSLTEKVFQENDQRLIVIYSIQRQQI